MKLKKILALAAMALVSAPAFAQYEGTDVNDRIGHGEDSLKCRENLTLFGDYFKAKNYAEAYPCWKFVIEKAPLAQAMIYTRGWTLLSELINQSAEKTDKKKYLDELMAMHDTRIKWIKELNSFSSPKMQSSKGAILCRKAFDYSKHGPVAYDDYSLNTAYDMFTEGINLVNEDPSHEVEAYVLHTYMNVSYAKYKADPENFRGQFIEDYLLCKEVCEKMLEHANQETDSVAAKKIVDQYDPTYFAVQNLFAESNAADRDWLIKYYTPKVEEHKSDIKFLRSAINILANNDCDDTDAYFKASKYAYTIEPSFASAIGVAQQLTKAGKDAESVQYYDKAIELAPDNKTKARIAMKVVYALAKSGHGTSAENYLKKVESFDPSMAGRADLFRAQNAAASKNYTAALAFATSAASKDPAISGSASRLKARITEFQRRQSEYDKANAEYKAQLEKQQRLENFWKGN